MELASPERSSPWPHRLSVALALVTFPLIWVGGLVTTYDAGMAVPDWPGTYGYNLFLYPWQSWIAAPFDLFIEHGHRLLGAAAGFVAIGLVGVVLLTDRRTWLKKLAIGALLLVVLQGVLGGARVLLDERMVAMIHGCVGPLFFAYLAALIVITSGPSTTRVNLDSRLANPAWTTVLIGYLQLMLGASIRHMPASSAPTLFIAAASAHLIVAGLLIVQIARLCWNSARIPTDRGTRGLVTVLATLVLVQLGLGFSTYVANYGYPPPINEFSFAAGYVVQEKGWLQALITRATSP